VLNGLLIVRYRQLKAEHSIWWAPVVLHDIVLYFVMFAQMLIEYLSWGEKVLKWRKDLVFEQRFTQEDKSETRILTNLDSVVE
jgi:hypothetical protein